MDYLYEKVENASFVENTIERQLFRKLLNKVAKALKEIEWADSCDTAPGDHDTPAIMKCLNFNPSEETIKLLRDNLKAYSDGIESLIDKIKVKSGL